MLGILLFLVESTGECEPEVVLMLAWASKA